MKPNLKVERVNVSEVTAHPRNARRGDLGVIVESLEAHGQYRPLVVQLSTGYVLAGNHTLKAALQLGWTQVEVTRIDVDDEQALRILLVDNKSNDLAGYDDDPLSGILEQLSKTPAGLSGTGFADNDYAALVASLEFVETPDFHPDTDGQPRLDQREPLQCPACQYKWRVGARDEIIPA